MRLLGYGLAYDAVDEYCRMAESTANESLDQFVNGIIACYEDKYLRSPTPADMERHMSINASRGFPGMFGSIDCTHWTWNNCPVAHHGQYQDRSSKRSIILEAIATADLWIWHAFVGVPGSCNDINVFDRSTLLVNYMSNMARVAMFEVFLRFYLNYLRFSNILIFMLSHGTNISATCRFIRIFIYKIGST